MKRIPIILLSLLLTGCAMKPAEMIDLSRVITTDYYASHLYIDDGIVESYSTYDVKEVTNRYLSEDYIVFVDCIQIVTFEDITKTEKEMDRFEANFETYLAHNFRAYKPDHTTLKEKTLIDGNSFIIVQRIISPPKPTGWRSWIPDEAFTFNKNYPYYRNSRKVEIDRFPEWTDTIDPKLIGGEFQ